MKIDFLPRDTAFNDIIALHDLINEVYEDAEKGFWVDAHQRIDPETLTELIAQGEIAVARENDDIIASICIQARGSERMEFSMLVTDPAFRNRGIGKQLIRFAEEHARNNKCSSMQLILVKPLHQTHPGKAELERWYRSMGYQSEKKTTAEDLLPHLRDKMIIPCSCELFVKAL